MVGVVQHNVGIHSAGVECSQEERAVQSILSPTSNYASSFPLRGRCQIDLYNAMGTYTLVSQPLKLAAPGPSQCRCRS